MTAGSLQAPAVIGVCLNHISLTDQCIRVVLSLVGIVFYDGYSSRHNVSILIAGTGSVYRIGMSIGHMNSQQITAIKIPLVSLFDAILLLCNLVHILDSKLA